MNSIENASVLQRLGLGRMDLCSLWKSFQHYFTGLVAIIDDDYLDIALSNSLSDSLNGFFRCRVREDFSRLGHI